MNLSSNWVSTLVTFLTAKLLPAVLVLLVGMWVIKFAQKFLDKLLAKSKLEKTAHSMIKAVVKTVLYLILILMVASQLGIDVSSIVTLASVLTLAVSLAVQDILTNLFGGFTLLYTQPFKAGDFVEIAGQSGTVKEVGMAYTKLVTVDNKLISIPNSAVTAAQIINYTVMGTRRVDISVRASYDTPMDDVLDALREAAQLPTALSDPAPFVAVKSYGESAIEYLLQVWCNSADYWSTLCETNKNVKVCFDAHGIEMTYPHLNVHLENKN